ncbi:MAG: exosortase H [Acidobacteriota bacterium]
MMRKPRALDLRALRFVGVFSVLVFSLTFLVQLGWMEDRLIAPYTRMLSALGGITLETLGTEVQVLGTVIRHDGFAVDIRRGCDGVVATILLVSACLAYPFSWKDRLLGTSLGYVLIFVLNMFRIVGLFLVGVRGSTQTFDFFHTYVSQFGVITVTMVFWIYWAGRRRTDSTT